MIKDVRIMKRKEIQNVTGLSRSSIYSKMSQGTFPKAIKLSERSVGWLEHEVQQWLSDRVIATRGGVCNEIS